MDSLLALIPNGTTAELLLLSLLGAAGVGALIALRQRLAVSR